ncbi:MAG: PepSY domain-containing protein [Pseudomonadales bacterium]|nr:PepSY domain-containing protein [Pseudomonadales bacterium]
MAKHTLIKWARQGHQSLAWLGAIALFTFVISALTHPIMVWTGPQSTRFMPPSMVVDKNQVAAVPQAIKASGIDQAIITKVVPSQGGPLLQITTSETQPRRYFSLDTLNELVDYDKEQAAWLARYYTGLDTDIKSIEFITEFSETYPWVNRLIPVYKVTFASDENLSAYVYTETNALASLNNDWKRSLQSVFQALHTWSWLNEYSLLRVAILSLLLLALTALLLMGLVMMQGIKRKRFDSGARRWHRVTAWIVFLPLLGFSISGIYHLIQHEYGENLRGMRLGKPIALQNIPNNFNIDIDTISGQSLNSFSLISHDERLYFRTSLAREKSSKSADHSAHQHHSPQKIRNQRFDGVSKEKSAIYIPVSNDSTPELNDSQLANHLVLNYLALPENHSTTIERITRFGPEYDFRNKRLPVWKITADTQRDDRIFVDPRTGILVDHLVDSQRYEGLSFSILHKWNFLRAFMDREQRDIIVVVVLVITFLLGVLGVVMKLKRKKKARVSQPTSSPHAGTELPVQPEATGH